MPKHGTQVQACVDVSNTDQLYTSGCSEFITWDTEPPVVKSLKLLHPYTRQWIEPKDCGMRKRQKKAGVQGCAVELWTNSSSELFVDLVADDVPTGKISSAMWAVLPTLLDTPDDRFLEVAPSKEFEKHAASGAKLPLSSRGLGLEHGTTVYIHIWLCDAFECAAIPCCSRSSAGPISSAGSIRLVCVLPSA